MWISGVKACQPGGLEVGSDLGTFKEEKQESQCG